MFRYIARRLLVTIPVVFGVCTLTFLLIHLVPGDPVDIMLGDNASAFDKQALRSDLGLDQPPLEQYMDFLANLTSLDLGRSLHSRESVTSQLFARLPATFELTLAAMAMAICFAVPLGVVAAIRQYSLTDNLSLISSLIGMSIPGFFLGPMLIWIFAIQLDLLPVSERGGLEHLILPALSLSIPLAAILMRMTRTSMLDVVHEDFIAVARAKGLEPRVVYFKHALSNAIMPVITIIGLQVGALLTGTVITETIFDWPGIGTLLYQGIQRRDYPVVQGCILLIALIYVIVNLLTDLLYALVNPKIRYS